MQLKFVLLVFMLQIFNCMQAQINPSAEIKTILFSENGNFPNNPDLPVLLYKNVFDSSGNDPATEIEKAFSQNNWGGSWRNGIYNFQHYHSTAHEALGVYSEDQKMIRLKLKKVTWWFYQPALLINASILVTDLQWLAPIPTAKTGI
jgi:hypothetical protein